MALQRFTRRAAEAAQGTGEAKDALAQMGIALRPERQPAQQRGSAADVVRGVLDQEPSSG
jgi:hypothetical protein